MPPFLPNKEASTYKMVLENLVKHGLSDPQQIHLDFEPSASKAAKCVFPNCKVIGCDTHWKRCLRERMSKVGLLSYYNQDVQIQTAIRKLWALSLVPVEDVVDTWQELQKEVPVMDEDDMDEEVAQHYNKAIEDFLHYFEQTWIGLINRRTEVRGRPKVPFPIWNKYREVVDGVARTNNASESWNSASKLGLPRKPSVWTVLDTIKKEESLARYKIVASVQGSESDSHPGRTKKIKDADERLREVVGKYSSLPRDEYLSIVAAYYNE